MEFHPEGTKRPKNLIRLGKEILRCAQDDGLSVQDDSISAVISLLHCLIYRRIYA